MLKVGRQKTFSVGKNSFGEKVEMEECRKHIAEKANRLVKLGMHSMGWRSVVEGKFCYVDSK